MGSQELGFRFRRAPCSHAVSARGRGSGHPATARVARGGRVRRPRRLCAHHKPGSLLDRIRVTRYRTRPYRRPAAIVKLGSFGRIPFDRRPSRSPETPPRRACETASNSSWPDPWTSPFNCSKRHARIGNSRAGRMFGFAAPVECQAGPPTRLPDCALPAAQTAKRCEAGSRDSGSGTHQFHGALFVR